MFWAILLRLKICLMPSRLRPAGFTVVTAPPAAGVVVPAAVAAEIALGEAVVPVKAEQKKAGKYINDVKG